MSNTRIIDLAYNLDPTTPVYPGDPPVTIEVVESTRSARPDGRRSLNCGRVTFGTHNGTHMDAPFHFFEDLMSIDHVPLEICIGKALMIDVRDRLSDGMIGVQHLKPLEAEIREIRRLVVHSGWSSKWSTPEFFSSHPVFTPEAAEFIVECGARLVAIDFPSVDRAPFPIHIAFLSRGVIIVENLTNLSALRKSVFDLIVLPLKLTGRDGSPVRAIAMETLEDS